MKDGFSQIESTIILLERIKPPTFRVEAIDRGRRDFNGAWAYINRLATNIGGNSSPPFNVHNDSPCRNIHHFGRIILSEQEGRGTQK